MNAAPVLKDLPQEGHGNPSWAMGAASRCSKTEMLKELQCWLPRSKPRDRLSRNRLGRQELTS